MTLSDYDFRRDAIAPHGGVLVDRHASVAGRHDLAGKIAAADLPAVRLDEDSLADLELIACGAYSPLVGFLGPRDVARIRADGRLADGLPWGEPVALAVPADAALAGVMALVGADDRPVGAMTVAEAWTDGGRRWAGGPVVLFDRPVGARRLAPRDTRALFRDRGWRRIAAYEVAGPILRAHEHIAKAALDVCDGLLLCPSDELAQQCVDILVDRYFPPERVVVTTLRPTRGGALHQAIVRKNQGCTHVVVARGDTASLAAYSAEELGIVPLRFAPAFFCRRCGGTATEASCPHDRASRAFASEARLADWLRAGERPPEEIMRPEVAEALFAALR